QRKWLTVAGYALSAFSKPFLYIASNWLGVLAVRVADRAGKGIRTSPRDALIAESVDEHTRGIAFGLHRAGDTGGASVGLIIALFVVLPAQSQANTLERATFEHIVLISIIPVVLAVIVLAVFAKAVRPKAVQDKLQATRLSFGALDRRFRYFLLIV